MLASLPARKTILLALSFSFTLFIFSSSIAFADTPSSDPGSPDYAATPPTIVLQPVIGFSSIGQATNTLISAAFLGGALLTFFYIIRGAFKYVTAGDNAANTQAARSTIQNAVIGLIILACVYVLFKIMVGIIPGLGQFFS